MNTTPENTYDLADHPRPEGLVPDRWTIDQLHQSFTDRDGAIWPSAQAAGLVAVLDTPEIALFIEEEPIDEAPEPPEEPEALRLFLAAIGEVILGDHPEDAVLPDSIEEAPEPAMTDAELAVELGIDDEETEPLEKLPVEVVDFANFFAADLAKLEAEIKCRCYLRLYQYEGLAYGKREWDESDRYFNEFHGITLGCNPQPPAHTGLQGTRECRKYPVLTSKGFVEVWGNFEENWD